MKTFQMVVLVMVISAGLAGCSTPEKGINRDIFSSQALANPASGPAVRLDRISDDRHFQKSGVGDVDAHLVFFSPFQWPTDPEEPMTFDNRIDDTAYNARVFRFSSYTTRPLLLDHEQTVIGLLYDPTVFALKKAGFRVLRSGDAGYEQAFPVTVSIENLWSWVHMDGVQIAVSCKYRVTLSLKRDGLTKTLTASGEGVRDSWTTINGNDTHIAIDLAVTDYEKKLEAELAQTKF
ncbi:MAG TPA: hypothetical protein VKP60_13380 [Magnetospirillaceae bacterium]|nr:hypothetical protein [Magnetospirillaceae bacterium]